MLRISSRTSAPSGRSSGSLGTRTPLANFARTRGGLRRGTSRGGFRARSCRWRLRGCRRNSRAERAGIEREIGQGVRFAIAFAANVLDDEIFELAREFRGAFVERLEIGALYLVAALHLADEQVPNRCGCAGRGYCGWRRNRGRRAARSIRRRCWCRGRASCPARG